MSTDRPALKFLALRRADTCRCGTALGIGERAAWDSASRIALCLSCASPSPEPARLDLGVAGGSAQGEFDRRHGRREAAVREAHPRLGGFLLAVTDDPQSTRAWRSGANGERRVGEKLASLDAVIALHDRAVPRSRANLDHVVVAPSGVFVVDAKHYHRTDVSIRRTGGIFGPMKEQLMVGGRDKTKLADAMQWQVDAVRAALADDTPVTAVLCFVDAQFPLFTKLDIGGVRVVGLRGLGKLVSTDGLRDASARDALAHRLALGLPAKR